MREDAAIVEVFGNVARLTTRKTALLSLCVVSRAAHAGAARWLYRNVELSRTLRAFCWTVKRSPKLASYVRSLSIVNAGLSDQTTRLLIDALSRLPNLHHVALPPLEHVLSNHELFSMALATLPNLDSIVLQRAGEQTQVLCHKLPPLRSLQLHFGLQSLGDLHPTSGCGKLLVACQETLEELNIHGFDLASFLEPRQHLCWPRVRSLTLLSTTNIDEVLVAAFPNVEKLILRDIDFPAEILCDPRMWPRLRQLTLSLPNLIDGEPDGNGSGKLRVLQRFSVWNTHMVDPEFIMEQLRYYDLQQLTALQFYSAFEFAPSLICTIFRSCPNLRLLGIRFDSMKSPFTEVLQAGEGPNLEFLSITLSNYVFRSPDPHPIEILGRHFPRLRIVDFIVMRTAAVQWRVSHDPIVEVSLENDAEHTSIECWEMIAG
ncbi:hypothetical protein EXIGLDRAFT_415710 [Exidia glandulosa HHB12029]|uniref:F-box domain-containing protein n=1 Tax=Exidia glandulosa HHB12029 TaxID=1314781 RepID=A0A165PRN6_EXIGL|nr:hypothetical protein EXIGLDRAFT_415710 [Exidia glandulosa HHB12029]